VSSRDPWRSARANCRNTACTTALGPTRPRLLWTFHVDSSGPGAYDDYLTGPPAIDASGNVYVGTGSGLVSLAPNGEPRWRVPTTNAAASPALDEASAVVSAAYAKGVLWAYGSRPDVRWADVALTGSAHAASIADNGSIYLACEQRVVEVSPDGRETWSAPCLRGIPFPPAVSNDGAVYFKTHDTMVWDWEDPSESYDSLEGHRSKIWKASFSHTDTTESTWAQSHGGDCAAICASDGTPIGGYKSTIVIGTREIAMPGAGGPLALSDDGTLYVGLRDGLLAIRVRLTAFAEATAVKKRDARYDTKPDAAYETRWRVPIEHGAMHPVVDGAGTIFVVSDNRTVHAIGAAGDRVWTWPMPNPHEGAGMAGWTHGLAIGPGRLYVALFSDLLALGD